jgi:hypothetical protein
MAPTIVDRPSTLGGTEMGSLVEAKMAGGKGGKGGNLPSKDPPAGFVNDFKRLRRWSLHRVVENRPGGNPAETGRKPAETS